MKVQLAKPADHTDVVRWPLTEPLNGWTIDGGLSDAHEEAVDAADAEALYRLLEQDVVPAFYERDRDGVPRRWIRIVKEAIRSEIGRAHV